jgi:hypothetical protein
MRACGYLLVGMFPPVSGILRHTLGEGRLLHSRTMRTAIDRRLYMPYMEAGWSVYWT